MASMLLTHNATSCAADALGKTATHYAVASGDIDTVVELTNAGASVEAQDNDGRTPISEAVLQDDANMIKFLSQGLSANANHRDKDGHTPLTLAASVGAASAVDSLIVSCGKILSVPI